MFHHNAGSDAVVRIILILCLWVLETDSFDLSDEDHPDPGPITSAAFVGAVLGSPLDAIDEVSGHVLKTINWNMILFFADSEGYSEAIGENEVSWLELAAVAPTGKKQAV